MSYQVLARKYRPSTFSEVVGQEHILKALENSIKHNKLHQAYIFSGTRGVGKTTIARVFAKCLNCQKGDMPQAEPCNECAACLEIKAGRHIEFLEVDAASRTGVDDMRELLESVQYKPANARYKIYLIDEVHMLSKSSFNALLKTLEEPPPHVMFLMATTEVEKVPKTVLSRCLQLNLKIIPENQIRDHIQSLLDLESIKYDEESLGLIANSAQGSIRDGLTLLDQAIAHGNGSLEAIKVGALLGTIDNTLLLSLLNSIIDGNGEQAFNDLYKIEELSPEYDSVLKNLISVIHQMSLHQVLKNSKDPSIDELCNKVDPEFCQLLYEIAVNSYSKFSVHPNAKEALEICLLRMLAFNPLHKIDEAPKKNVSTESVEKKTLKIDVVKEQNNSEPQIEETITQNQKEIVKTSAQDSLTSIKNQDDWIAFFDDLDLSPFARNYFGHLSFKSLIDKELTLNTADEESSIPENVFKEFSSVCGSKLKFDIQIKIEQGDASFSPINIQSKKEAQTQSKAKESISSNQSIQNFLKKHNGNIDENSIKPRG